MVCYTMDSRATDTDREGNVIDVNYVIKFVDAADRVSTLCCTDNRTDADNIRAAVTAAIASGKMAGVCYVLAVD